MNNNTKNINRHCRVLILGSGPAGYTAAIYAARANLNPVVISGFEQGGQLMTATEVDNWPGNLENLRGPELIENIRKHVEKFDDTLINDHIHSVKLNEKPFILEGYNGTYSCDALIISTGASARYLGIPSEEEYKGKGVSGCATCDGFFYRGKTVAVIGGGNVAVEEAVYLSNIASKVIIVHRKDEFSSEKIISDQLFEKEKNGIVSIKWHHTLEEVVGDGTRVTGMKIKDVKTDTITHLAVDGIFIAIGHKPNTDIFKGQLDMDNKGYLKIKSGTNGNATSTSVQGVFAAGDVADPIYRQAITSAGSGCMAALDAEKYIENQRFSNTIVRS
ncbi:MAG: thioredoxin-disulfide reductase [Methanosarcinaceae archaeon]|jgi:thioredoxin reductase (NADPH)|nr:thioredoxin-disulfide reductase [Methanosarcinaceae archaeon]NKQ39487.1 thioredoxin-disulfide reductase [Methanosarcinales archaeon]